MVEATTDQRGPCQVRSVTGHPCPHQAAVEIRGVPFCESCAREQEAYFAMGELTRESQGFRGEPLVGALDVMRRGGGTSVGNGPRKERGPFLPSGYRLDQADPDAVVLRRPDGSEIATFSAVGADPREVEEGAWEDFGGREG